MIGKFGIPAEVPERGERNRRTRRRNRGGEDERRGCMAEEVDDRPVRRDITAEGGERLGERTHQDVDLVRETEVMRRTASARTDDAESMRIIDHHRRTVGMSETADFGKIGEITAEREDAVHDHERTASVGHGLELRFQMRLVVVPEAQELAEAHLRGAVDARMRLLVANEIIATADECADHAEIRLKAGPEGKGLVLAKEVRQFRFEFEVKVERSVEEARTRAARSVFPERRPSRLDDFRAGCESEVVVRAQHNPPAPFHHHFNILPRLQAMEVRINARLTRGFRARILQAFVKECGHLASARTVTVASLTDGRRRPRTFGVGLPVALN